MTRSRPIALLLLLWAAAPAPDARAGEPDAETLIRRGVALRNQLRDEEALALFEQAWQRARTPRARAQMGLAEQALGRWLDAEAHLGEALGASEDSWIRHNREALDRALGVVRTHVGGLLVLGGPAGATVTVNDRPAPALPWREPIRFVAGVLKVRVEAPAHASEVRTVPLPGGELVRETIELFPIAPPPRPLSGIGDRNPGPSMPPPLVAPDAIAPAPARPQATGSNRGLAIALGVGGAALVIGLAVGLGVGLSRPGAPPTDLGDMRVPLP